LLPLFWGDRRALDAFPTRRSSDLRHRRGFEVQRLQVLAALELPQPFVRHLREGEVERLQVLALRQFLQPRVRDLGEAEEVQEPRSEEHTSELQSRRDLVCRLLLEK